jgi:hypothetical protein
MLIPNDQRRTPFSSSPLTITGAKNLDLGDNFPDNDQLSLSEVFLNSFTNSSIGSCLQ